MKCGVELFEQLGCLIPDVVEKGNVLTAIEN